MLFCLCHQWQKTLSMSAWNLACKHEGLNDGKEHDDLLQEFTGNHGKGIKHRACMICSLTMAHSRAMRRDFWLQGLVKLKGGRITQANRQEHAQQSRKSAWMRQHHCFFARRTDTGFFFLTSSLSRKFAKQCLGACSLTLPPQ
jgi:hypothetical protein